MAENQLGKFAVIAHLAAIIAPFFVFWVQRIVGTLPSYAKWAASLSNHGPWHFEPESYLILTPLFALIPATILLTVVRPTTLGRLSRTKTIMGLLALNLLGIYCHVAFLFWLID